jgi:selenide, water dikinase
MEEVRLTQYSHGAGCGCKISPKILDSMLKSDISYTPDAKLLVGNSTKDDAAVYDIGDGKAIISTTDFFMPIVDDAFDFGRIASANAISDIYAMGGTPIIAIAVLGWPIDKLDASIAQRVLEGSRAVCAEAGIHLAGGHSIDNQEPLFGLAVTGIADIKNIKQNNKATENCSIYLTKPVGIGILTTAQKKGILKEEHKNIAPNLMLQLNKIGAELGKLDYVKALTDVTGFGLGGHLIEICEGSGISAELNFDLIPKIDCIDEYLAQKSIPGGTNRNFDSYGHKISKMTDYQKQIVCDPQTSGGLLIIVDNNKIEEFTAFMRSNNYQINPIGQTIKNIDNELVKLK